MFTSQGKVQAQVSPNVLTQSLAYSAPCATLLNSSRLWGAVMVSQLCSRLTMMRVRWTLEDLTHRRPFIPTTSSQGNSCCRSDRTSLSGASSLGGDAASTVRTDPLSSPPSDPREKFLPSDEAQRNGEEQTASSKHSHPVGSTRTVDANQLRLHVLIGYEELGEHQVSHLHDNRGRS